MAAYQLLGLVLITLNITGLRQVAPHSENARPATPVHVFVIEF